MTTVALSDAEWSAPCVSLSREVLCVGTPIALDGYRRPLQPRELAWLHAALTGAIGRGHQRPTHCTPADWSLVPWACPSGWAVAWWSEADAAALSGTARQSRIGAVECTLAIGARTRVHVPPAYVAGVHLVRLTMRTPLVITATDSDGRKRSARAVSDSRILSSVWTLARKLGVRPGALAVSVLDDRSHVDGVDYRGKIGRVEGLAGTADLAVNAPTRWLLECAARGLGLGARTAYGCGRVEATTLAR